MNRRLRSAIENVVTYVISSEHHDYEEALRAADIPPGDPNLHHVYSSAVVVEEWLDRHPIANWIVVRTTKSGDPDIGHEDDVFTFRDDPGGKRAEAWIMSHPVHPDVEWLLMREREPDDGFGTPEHLGGSPRTNADDAYATFMTMPEDEWLGVIGSLVKGGTLTVEEREGFDRASEARARRAKGELS